MTHSLAGWNSKGWEEHADEWQEGWPSDPSSYGPWPTEDWAPPRQNAHVEKERTMEIEGGSDPVIAPIIRGWYNPNGHHHNRCVFIKPRVGSVIRVCCYYDDGRDGPENNAWWLSADVGSEVVRQKN